MKKLRFDRLQAQGATDEAPPEQEYQREPVLKRIIQILVLAVGIYFIGYWIINNAVFREYRGIVRGDNTELRNLEFGVVGKLYFGDHMSFRKGATLLEVEFPELQSKHDLLTKELELLESELRLLDAEELNNLRADLAIAQATLASFQAKKDLLLNKISQSDQIYEKSKVLFAKQAITAATLRHRQSELNRAKYESTSIEKELSAARQDYETATAQLQSALQSGTLRKRQLELKIAKTKAQLRELDKKLEASQFIALRNGIVTKVNKLTGDTIWPKEVLLKLVYEGNLWIDLFIDPNDSNEIPVGSEVIIKPEGILGQSIKGVVFSHSPATQTIPHSHRDSREALEQFIVGKVVVDLEEAIRSGLTIGQDVKIQVLRW